LTDSHVAPKITLGKRTDLEVSMPVGMTPQCERPRR
jgi:hypothetical protein